MQESGSQSSAQSGSQTVQTNVQIIRTIYELGKQGNLPGILGYIDAEFEAVEAESLPYGGTYRGPEGLGRLLAQVFQVWRSFEFEVDKILDAGEYVIAILRVKIGLRASGQDVNMTIAEFWRLRDGKVIELRPYYWDTAALLGSSRA